MRKNANATGNRFWSRYAGIYDRFMRKDNAAYQQMYQKIRTVVAGKDVLELATGTGLIAKNIVNNVRSIEATDASSEMIAEARKNIESSKLHFSVQDIFHLPYADESFPVIIAANVLHIIPEPEKAIAEIKRVLTADGILILPTFTHAEMGSLARAKVNAMKSAGFPLQHAWSPESYQSFLQENGLVIHHSAVFDASFPLTYVECTKS